MKTFESRKTNLGDVGHGPDELVVVGQEVIVQPLGVGVPAKINN